MQYILFVTNSSITPDCDTPRATIGPAKIRIISHIYKYKIRNHPTKLTSPCRHPRTTLGWLNDRNYDQRVRFERNVPLYRGASDLDRLIRFAMDSCADYCIIPMQDYLGLDDVARINTPGTLGDNWAWRLAKNYDKASLVKHVAKLTAASGRNR